VSGLVTWELVLRRLHNCTGLFMSKLVFAGGGLESRTGTRSVPLGPKSRWVPNRRIVAGFYSAESWRNNSPDVP